MGGPQGSDGPDHWTDIPENRSLDLQQGSGWKGDISGERGAGQSGQVSTMGRSPRGGGRNGWEIRV